MKHNIYAVYDTWDNDIIVCMGEIYEVINFLQATNGNIRQYIQKGCLYKKRYLVCKVFDRKEI